MLRHRRLAAGVAALFVTLGLSGCATTSLTGTRTISPNPLVVPSADFETVWKAAVEVVDDYFSIAQENRLAGKIVTDPKISATLLEPWDGDTVGFQNRLESSLQTIRRFAIVTVRPAPGGGGYLVKVEVHKQLEDLVKPMGQMGGARAVFNNDFPVNRTREVVGPTPLPVGWIDRNRDPKLEQVILARLRHRLFL